MPHTNYAPILRIIDANLNRTREGLRVCEDISRFIIRDKEITRALKSIRHSVTKAVSNSKAISLKNILQTRDIENDCTKFFDFKRRKGNNSINIFLANIERVKESLRVLEECCKVVDEALSRKYRRLRFNTYDVEKRFVEKLRHIPSYR